jgi:hypothetical protein
MKKYCLRSLLCFGICCLIISSGCSQPRSKNFDETLVEIVATLQKDYPKQLDPETSLDSISALPGKVILYSYTLSKRSKDELDSAALTKALQPLLLDAVKTNKDIAELRRNNVKFIYKYFDKNGVYFFRFIITPAMYKKH